MTRGERCQSNARSHLETCLTILPEPVLEEEDEKEKKIRYARGGVRGG